MLLRPWCILEIHAAVSAGVPLVGVTLRGKGYDHEKAKRQLIFLDTELEKLNPGALGVLRENGLDPVDGVGRPPVAASGGSLRNPWNRPLSTLASRSLLAGRQVTSGPEMCDLTSYLSRKRRDHVSRHTRLLATSQDMRGGEKTRAVVASSGRASAPRDAR